MMIALRIVIVYVAMGGVISFLSRSRGSVVVLSWMGIHEDSRDSRFMIMMVMGDGRWAMGDGRWAMGVDGAWDGAGGYYFIF